MSPKARQRVGKRRTGRREALETRLKRTYFFVETVKFKFQNVRREFATPKINRGDFNADLE